MRLPWPAVAAGVVVVALGAAGLVRGVLPASSASSGGTSSAPIVVTNAYVRAPVPPIEEAAAYFTIYNTTGKPDQLISVSTGAGRSAVLHDGAMRAESTVTVPAHGQLILSPGKGHLMIENLIGTLAAGQTVDIAMIFQNAGPVNVTAKVIAANAPQPTVVSS